MKATLLAILLVIGLAISTTQMYAQHEHPTGDMPEGHTMKSDADARSDEEKPASDKARCAFEGMMMKKSAMASMEHGDETLYFCNEAQKEMFQKDPEKYVKKIAVGTHHITMNSLTIKEYMDMMNSMGMSKMMKKGDPNDTHWISAYLDVHGEPMELAGITAKLTTPGGKTTLKELKYDKMMKAHTGRLSLIESGKYKLSLLLESSGIEMP